MAGCLDPLQPGSSPRLMSSRVVNLPFHPFHKHFQYASLSADGKNLQILLNIHIFPRCCSIRISCIVALTPVLSTPHPYHSPLLHRVPSAILMGQTSQIDSPKADTKNNRHGWFQLYDSSSPASAFSRRKIPRPPSSNAASSPSSSARTARRPPASESRM